MKLFLTEGNGDSFSNVKVEQAKTLINSSGGQNEVQTCFICVCVRVCSVCVCLQRVCVFAMLDK